MSLFKAFFGHDELVNYTAEYEDGTEVKAEGMIALNVMNQRDVVNAVRQCELDDTGEEPSRITIDSRTAAPWGL